MTKECCKQGDCNDAAPSEMIDFKDVENPNVTKYNGTELTFGGMTDTHVCYMFKAVNPKSHCFMFPGKLIFFSSF